MLKRKCKYCGEKFYPTSTSNVKCLECQLSNYRVEKYGGKIGSTKRKVEERAKE